MNREIPALLGPSRTHGAAANPFAQQRLERLPYRFADDLPWDTHLDRLSRTGYRAAIVGPRGSGKSTLLRELHRRLSTGDGPTASMGQDGFAAEAISEPLPAIRPATCGIGRQPGLQTLLIDIPPLCSSHTSTSDDFGLTRLQRKPWLCERLARLNSQSVLLLDGIERLPWSQRMWLIHCAARPARCAGVVVALHQPCRWMRLPIWVRAQPTVALLEQLLVELGVANSVPPTLSHQLFRRHAGNLREVLRELFDGGHRR